MSQFMREQSLPFARVRRILARRERNVPTDRKRLCIDRTGCTCRLSVSVNTHLTEVGSEAWFEECSCYLRQRTSPPLHCANVRGDCRSDLPRIRRRFLSVDLRFAPRYLFDMRSSFRTLLFAA